MLAERMAVVTGTEGDSTITTFVKRCACRASHF
jgi:hypothetical protein